MALAALAPNTSNGSNKPAATCGWVAIIIVFALIEPSKPISTRKPPAVLRIARTTAPVCISWFNSIAKAEGNVPTPFFHEKRRRCGALPPFNQRERTAITNEPYSRSILVKAGKTDAIESSEAIPE